MTERGVQNIEVTRTDGGEGPIRRTPTPLFVEVPGRRVVVGPHGRHTTHKTETVTHTVRLSREGRSRCGVSRGSSGRGDKGMPRPSLTRTVVVGTTVVSAGRLGKGPRVPFDLGVWKRVEGSPFRPDPVHPFSTTGGVPTDGGPREPTSDEKSVFSPQGRVAPRTGSEGEKGLDEGLGTEVRVPFWVRGTLDDGESTWGRREVKGGGRSPRQRKQSLPVGPARDTEYGH